MLACGANCQPTNVEREIKAFASSASPFHVSTDVGDGFVKAPNNPYGPQVCIAELVAAELGTWFGLKIPSFAVIANCGIELMMKNGQLMEAPLFFSLRVDGETFDGGDTFLAKLRDKGDVARLVIFDTWLRNWDRYGLDDWNYENLIFTPDKRKYSLVPIDHSWAFDGDFPVTISKAAVEDQNLYGKFPSFDPYIDLDAVVSALDDLTKLDRNFVTEVVNSVPAQWGLKDNASKALIDLICRRAEFVMNTITERLVDNPPLPGLHQNG